MEYTIQVAKKKFSKENEAMKTKKLELKLNTILLWLGRHVVHDYYKNSEWFGGEESNTDFVFWFKLEKDRNNSEIFIDEILENGIPKMRV